MEPKAEGGGAGAGKRRSLRKRPQGWRERGGGERGVRCGPEGGLLSHGRAAPASWRCMLYANLESYQCAYVCAWMSLSDRSACVPVHERRRWTRCSLVCDDVNEHIGLIGSVGVGGVWGSGECASGVVGGGWDGDSFGPSPVNRINQRSRTNYTINSIGFALQVQSSEKCSTHDRIKVQASSTRTRLHTLVRAGALCV